MAYSCGCQLGFKRCLLHINIYIYGKMTDEGIWLKLSRDLNILKGGISNLIYMSWTLDLKKRDHGKGISHFIKFVRVN